MINICLNSDELEAAGGVWDPEPDEYCTDGATGFLGFKWDEPGSLVVTLTLDGYTNDTSGAEAIIKAGTDHEHTTGLHGPDCTPETPTSTPTATSTSVPDPPTATPVEQVAGVQVTPPPEVVVLPSTGNGGLERASGSTMLMIAGLLTGLTGMGLALWSRKAGQAN